MQSNETTSTTAPSQEKNVTVIEDRDRTYYIIGTAHVSELSVQQVNQVIEEIKPDTVCIELCPARYAALTDDNRWAKLDIFKVIKEGKTLFLLASLAVGAYQRRLGQELGVRPGSELLAAAKKATEVGARIELVDRDIHITLKRTWANLGFTRKLTLLSTIMGSLVTREQIDAATIEKMKEQAQLSEMMHEFARLMPEVQKPLIDERDQYLISGVRESKGDRVVAVVGAGHVEGMCNYFSKPIDREALATLPKKRKLTSLIKWIIPALIIGAFAIGYFRNQGRTLQDMLLAWVLPNSVAAALLTTIAGGKLLSILCAAVASPITSLNPLLGAGMVVGLLEAWLRKPTVGDAERINEDVQSLRGIYRNPFTRVLLVAVASTIGSAVGAWIGLPWVFSKLAG